MKSEANMQMETGFICLKAYGPYVFFKDRKGMDTVIVLIIKPEGCFLYLLKRRHIGEQTAFVLFIISWDSTREIFIPIS